MTGEPTEPFDIDPRESGRGSQPHKALVFRLSGENFGINVSQVHEVIDPLPVTPVPNADRFSPGLVNVRGSVLPSIDMHLRLGLARSNRTSETRLMVVETLVENENTKLAMLTDGVVDIVDLGSRKIEQIPSFATRWPDDFVDGIAQFDKGLFVLLNTNVVFQKPVLNGPIRAGEENSGCSS